MIKKLASLLLITCCLLSMSVSAFAEESTQSGEIYSKAGDVTKPSASNDVYTYGWRVSSVVDYVYAEFGSWRIGPTGHGPGQLDINNSVTLNRNVFAQISGSYDIGEAAIGLALGVDIGGSKTYETHYSIPLAVGETKTIRYRPKYKVSSVESQYVKTNNMTGRTEVLKTETAYVKSFIDWDYDWVNGYQH